MSFLTIPSQEGLFTKVKKEGSSGEGGCYDEGQCNSDEEYEDREETNVRLIPRCSPIPRKRGRSIYDETAEYLKIKDAIPSRRVSFADTTGRDLTDVKEFVQFDSDDEDDARWEEEEAKYRPKIREPTYRINPEWTIPTAAALTKAVHINKVEVESVSPIEDEPLAFIVFIRVLNISFNKTVCIRSTMDSWSTYFDCPADYVQGDGETDKFSFKLSFCPPYLHHGARIEFVVRYETPDGDYWANNSQLNYSVTLLVSYEDDVAQASPFDMPDLTSILKTESSYSMEDSDYFAQFPEKGEDEPVTKPVPDMLKPSPQCPVILQPELDIETADDIPSSPLPANLDIPLADGTLSSATVSLGKQSPHVFSTSTTQANEVLSKPVASEANQLTTEPEPSQELDCELLKLDCEIPKLDSELEEHVPPPLHISIAEASDGKKEEKGGTFQVEPKDSSQPTPMHVPSPLPSNMEEVLDGEKEKEEDSSPSTHLHILTPPHVSIAEASDDKNEEKGGGTSQEEPTDSSSSTPRSSSPTPLHSSMTEASDVDEEGKEEEEGGAFTLEHTEPHSELDPPLTEIQANMPSSLEDVLYQSVLSATPNVVVGKLVEEEEDVEEVEIEVPEHGSKVEEDPRQEAEKDAEEENEKSFRIQETSTSSSSRLEHPSDSTHCKLSRAEEGSKSQIKVFSEASPSLSEESDDKQLTSMDDGMAREDGVLMLEAVGPKLESFQAGGEVGVVVDVVAICPWHPPMVPVTHLGPTGEDRMTQSLASDTAELPNDISQTSHPVSHQRFKRGVAAGLSELAAVLSEDSGNSKQQDDITAREHTTPGLESQTPLGVQCKTLYFAVTENISESSMTMTQDGTSSSNEEDATSADEEEETFQVSSETGLPSRSSEAQITKPLSPQAEPTLDRTLIPSIIFLSVAIGLVVGLHEPSTFLFMGLFLVSLCF
uniref:uncharacterized protein si:ch211-167b20.8 n=1 Tax=Oncorhynchus gorbuscha TaxID=8017 RepID=UPI001EAF016B|nr:uncharacterized protein si:ch211-167b20.8 [Oncorhynchus gorbuscha]